MLRVPLRAENEENDVSTAWILVVSPPRERPMALSSAAFAFFLGRSALLVNPDMRTVDHHDIAVASLGHRRQQLVPDPSLAPAHEPIVAGAVPPVALGNVSPGRACTKPPEDPVQHPTIIDPRHSTRLPRQQGLDDGPLGIGKIVTAHNHLRNGGAFNHNILILFFKGSLLAPTRG